jgi:hypothetical protein
MTALSCSVCGDIVLIGAVRVPCAECSDDVVMCAACWHDIAPAVGSEFAIKCAGCEIAARLEACGP